MCSCTLHTVTELVLHGFGLNGFSWPALLTLVTFLAELYVYYWIKLSLNCISNVFGYFIISLLSFFTHSATQLPTRRFSYPNMLLHAYIQAWTSNVDYMHMFHVYLHRMWITRSCSISTSRLHYQFGNLSVLLNKKKSHYYYTIKISSTCIPGKSFQSCTVSL